MMTQTPTDVAPGDVSSELFMPPLPPPWGWITVEHMSAGVTHALPTWDIHQHQFTETCRCGTTRDDGTIFHTAFDGREAYESERRVRH